MVVIDREMAGGSNLKLEIVYFVLSDQFAISKKKKSDQFAQQALMMQF